MDRISTFNTYSAVVNTLMGNEIQQSQLAQQVSSGFVAIDLKGFGVKAEALTAAQTVKTKVDSYVQNSTALAAKLDAQNLALTQVANAGAGARAAIANALATGSGQELMTSLQSYFGQAGAALNTQYNGEYLFAGGRTSTVPVPTQQMSDLISTPAVPPAAAWTPAVWSPNPATTYNNVFQNDQSASTTQLDESTTIQTGILASNAGGSLFNAFAQIQDFQQSSGDPISGQLDAAQTNFLTSMLQTFDRANQDLTGTTAANGMIQSQVAQSLTTQTDRQTSLQGMIGGITGVDMAQVSSQLAQVQTAIQASARIFSSLQTYSLLNFLQPPSAG
jgi:flagellar hook-associated protein 3 FlgL